MDPKATKYVHTVGATTTNLYRFILVKKPHILLIHLCDPLREACTILVPGPFFLAMASAACAPECGKGVQALINWVLGYVLVIIAQVM